MGQPQTRLFEQRGRSQGAQEGPSPSLSRLPLCLCPLENTFGSCGTKGQSYSWQHPAGRKQEKLRHHQPEPGRTLGVVRSQVPLSGLAACTRGWSSAVRLGRKHLGCGIGLRCQITPQSPSQSNFGHCRAIEGKAVPHQEHHAQRRSRCKPSGAGISFNSPPAKRGLTLF